MLYKTVTFPPTLIIITLVICGISQAASITPRAPTWRQSPIPSLRLRWDITSHGGLEQFWSNCHCPTIIDLVLASDKAKHPANLLYKSPAIRTAGITDAYTKKKGLELALDVFFPDHIEQLDIVRKVTCREQDQPPVDKSVEVRLLRAMLRMIRGSITFLLSPTSNDECKLLEEQVGCPIMAYCSWDKSSDRHLKIILEDLTQLAADREVENGVTAVYKVFVASGGNPLAPQFGEPIKVWPPST